MTAVSIGPNHSYEDPYGTLSSLSEIQDGGVLIVRPDLYVAARHRAAPESDADARAWLEQVFGSILGLGVAG